jgi:tRNA pseudouridine55 synthase
MILNLYKPKGLSSFNFIYKVKKKLGYQKIGHAGTLDPLASGVMIVLTDKDTKKQNEYMKQDKVYLAEVLLGAFSESFDLEKTLIFSEKAPNLSKDIIEKTVKSLIGELTLPAPIYSAKVISGKRLYKYAKQGLTEIELPKVTSIIKDIKIINQTNFEHEGQFYPLLTLEISCTSGTYIRSIANHLGDLLGTKGVLFSLIRTQVGDFKIEDSTKLDLD